MEVLDEFDSEFPQSVTFCRPISVEDFERQAETYTERSLRRLFRTLDRNPALAERVVRMGKQAEREQRGLLSFLWARFFSAVEGDLNRCNRVSALEMHQRLEQLKRRMRRVHLYAQGAKRKRRQPRLKKLEPVLLKDRSTSPCLPPTLLPPPPLPPPITTMASVVASSPPVYTMPRVFGPFPPLSSKPVSSPYCPLPAVPAPPTSCLPCAFHFTSSSSQPSTPPPGHMVDLTPLVLNPGGFHFSYLSGNDAHKLHCPGFPWTSACSGSPNTDETPSPGVKASIFSPPVLLKFQPVPRPKDDSENEPGSAEPTPCKRSQ